ncbi:cyclase [Penicillium cf. griseofulvum]|uniref:Cyclase n=1 Tax=Penicillium cf. griseofulvum TaxID=2972120 RepID=A0A9W9J1E0_9EURO|nr:cyclase [Penicillium cf. griseofulvum]
MSGIPNLPETFDDLPDKRRFWPGTAGSEDEGLGMLRLLTPELVAQAARTQIQTGERKPGFGRKPFEHQVKWVVEGVAFDDEYHFNPQQSSQWDGLRHHNAPAPTPEDQDRRLFYGGTTAEEILDENSSRIGIGFWAKKGIAGRGVLIDYVSYAEKKGISIDALSRQMISLDEVQEIARECNIKFQKGDVFFLRGMLQHAGLEQSERILRFIWDNHFAAVASDAVSFEVYPALNPEFDLHHHILAGWGVPIGEMFDLDELAATCKRLGRWSFFISSSPLNCSRGVSSPPNCMAIF